MYSLNELRSVMDRSEALLFFPIESGDDLEDLYEERLFEVKQFLLTRPPIGKVFTSKIKKLEKMQAAYEMLSESTKKVTVHSQEIPHPDFSTIVITCFHQLHNYRTAIKGQVLKSESVSELASILNNWLAVEQKYQKNWIYPEVENDSQDVIISKEPDPMELLAGIKKWDPNEPPTKSFKELKEGYSFLPNKVQLEVKRLTLLYNK